MSEMVERVARAIAKRRSEIMLGADPATQTADERELARAAIAAMREPTHDMVSSGDNEPTMHSWGSGGEFAACKPIWESMIDAALKA